MGQLMPVLAKRLAGTVFGGAASSALLQKIVSGALAGAISAPFNGSLRVLLEHYAAGKRWPTREELTQRAHRADD
jgi:hypothetical protein